VVVGTVGGVDFDVADVKVNFVVDVDVVIGIVCVDAVLDEISGVDSLNLVIDCHSACKISVIFKTELVFYDFRENIFNYRFQFSVEYIQK
jgi:hypothetical protein